jgi:hypothetical protein
MPIYFLALPPQIVLFIRRSLGEGGKSVPIAIGITWESCYKDKTLSPKNVKKWQKK